MKLPGVVSLIVALAALSLIFAALERIGSSLPRKPLFRRERALDFVYWFFTPWISRTAAGIAVFLTIRLIAMQPSATWFLHQALAAQILELLVAADLLGYASHRAF